LHYAHLADIADSAEIAKIVRTANQTDAPERNAGMPLVDPEIIARKDAERVNVEQRRHADRGHVGEDGIQLCGIATSKRRCGDGIERTVRNRLDADLAIGRIIAAPRDRQSRLGEIAVRVVGEFRQRRGLRIEILHAGEVEAEDELCLWRDSVVPLQKELKLLGRHRVRRCECRKRRRNGDYACRD
jgi:hypothetical protein